MKQNTTIYSLFLLLALGIFSSCEKAETPKIETQTQAMRFNLLSPGQTKVSGDAFASGDKAGLYVTDYADASTPMPLQISGNRANNLAMTCDGAAWTPAKTLYWGDSKADVYAYYPYIESVSDVSEQPFAVSTDQSAAAGDGEMSPYESSDFLWAKAEGVSRSDGAVTLAMKHIMSKLTVKIVAGEDYVGSLPEDASVLLHSTVTDAKIDIEKGSAVKNPRSGSKSIRMRNLGVRTTDGVSAVVYDAIVVPQMLETSVPLIEINSKSVSYLLEDSFNFRPGVAYTYTATLNTSTTAIKVEIGCEIDDWNSTGGGSGSGSGDQGGDESGEDDGKTYADLSSASGPANCYLVSSAGDYKFPAVQGNIADATVGNVKSVEVLWETFGTDVAPNEGDLISSVSYKDGYIRFSTPETFAEGNASIAARNSKGTILWSWHIWLSSEGWKEQVYYNNAGTMMDRNLGALSATPGDAGANGLFYQWGRKDPFLGASSVSSNTQALSTGTWSKTSGGSTALAEENPMTFYTYLYLSTGSWDTKKTAYDPCPAGWRVPEGGADGVWAKASGKTESFNISSGSYGLNFSGTFGADETIWYPAAGCLNGDSGALCNVGSYGSFWSASPHPSHYYYAYSLYFYTGGSVYPVNGLNCSCGFPVRCLQEN